MEVTLENRDVRWGTKYSIVDSWAKNDRALQWEYVEREKELYVRKINKQLYMVFSEA